MRSCFALFKSEIYSERTAKTRRTLRKRREEKRREEKREFTIIERSFV
jgi:hypothetical protein